MTLQEEFSSIYQAYIEYLTFKLSRKEPIDYARFRVSGNTRTIEKVENGVIYLIEKSKRQIKATCQEADLWPIYKYLVEECNANISIIDGAKNEELKFLREIFAPNFVEFKKAIFIDLMQFKPLTALEREQLFNNEIESFKRLTKAEQEAFQEKANPKPEKIIVLQIVFKRNPYVVIKVLERAKGICERCLNKAPFNKDNGEPYLEVHHIQPLSEDGADTIDNCIALCPNCHRHAHYGKISY
jgi:hypothetical protein